MGFISFLLLSSVFTAVTCASGGLENEASISNKTNGRRQKVLTTTGTECTFPFRQGGRIHHHCINVLSSRPWCSLTHNFDRDRKWGFCHQPEETEPRDSCQENPCVNGGVCRRVTADGGRSSECACAEAFGGTRCEKKKCYETLHLRYYDTGESWGRIHLRNVEQCTCVSGETRCERVQYTACLSNPCRNEGTCRQISSTGQKVCHCRRSFSGADCSFEPETECYTNKGTGYRGVAGTTESGARCLPWNSDLLFDELHVGTVPASPHRGLGEHAYCRNPDGDMKPWCYTLNDSAISWEYCDVPSCVMPQTSSRRFNPFNMPAARKPKPSGRGKSPTCGTKHKKRLAVARGRILGGNSALPGTHPWMAAIYIGHEEFCAGSLISSCWIVSAAHCFFRNPLMSQIQVVLGQHHFNVTGSNTRTFGVEKYVFPERFSVYNPTLRDIVLVKLKKQDGRCVKKTPFIRPICLPDHNTTFPDNYCCAISGWGHQYEKADRYSSLQEGGVRLVKHEQCTMPQVYSNHVTEDMICAGNGCVDACQGDSGGPLACVRDDVSVLYGVISWGDGCGRAEKPGVYTKVLSYIDWIHSVIKPKRKAKSPRAVL